MVCCLVLKSGKQTHPNYLLIIDVTHLTYTEMLPFTIVCVVLSIQGYDYWTTGSSCNFNLHNYLHNLYFIHLIIN